MTKSWRTSLFGAGGLITLICTVIVQQTDGDPTTTTEWGVVIPLAITAIGNLFARDNVVTSEQVGVK